VIREKRKIRGLVERPALLRKDEGERLRDEMRNEK
jgi:hypothetical protein